MSPRLRNPCIFHEDSAIETQAQSPPFMTILKDAWGWGTKAAHYFCNEDPANTEGHLEYKSLGHRSLIIPRAPLLALSLHPADVKVTWSEWSWKVLQFPGCWEETAASCPQPEPGRAPPCTTRSTSELLPWSQPAAELGPLSSARPRLQLPTIRTKAQDLNPHETGQKEQHLWVRERPRMS